MISQWKHFSSAILPDMHGLDGHPFTSGHTNPSNTQGQRLCSVDIHNEQGISPVFYCCHLSTNPTHGQLHTSLPTLHHTPVQHQIPPHHQVLGLLKNPTTPPQYPTNPSNRSRSRAWHSLHVASSALSASLSSTRSKCNRRNTVIHACASS